MNPVIFLGYLSILIGAVVLIGGVRDLICAHRSKSWPQVEGVVTASSVAREQSADSGFRLRAAIRYEYSVKDRLCTGERIRFVNLGTSDVNAVVARYPVGSKVRVFYSPSDPNMSVLESGANWFQLLFIPAALVFMAAGVTMVIQGRQ